MLRPSSFLLAGLVAMAPALAAGGSLRVTLADSKGKPVEDAVVSLAPIDGAQLAVPPVTGSEVVQKGQMFIPYVTVVTVGTSVAFPNADTVQHHIYSLSKPKRFEKPLYAPGSRESVVFDQPGVVTLGCNIHDWMIAYIVVLPTPYFARSGGDGAALIEGLPAGRYRLEVWHPLLATVQSREVTVKADDGSPPESFILYLKADRRIHRAPESKSGGYR
jgi:plastocyanin